MGWSISGATKSWASLVGRLARLSVWVMASTGVGPVGLGVRAGMGFSGSGRQADDGLVEVERVDGGVENVRFLRWVVNLDVAPASVLAGVVYRCAPLVAGGVGLGLGWTGRLEAA